MKFLCSLGLLAFTGVFTCRASDPVPLDKALRRFLKDFNEFNGDSCCSSGECGAGIREAHCGFNLSLPNDPNSAGAFESKFESLAKTCHWDKKKISLPQVPGWRFLEESLDGAQAWQLMMENYLFHWFSCHARIHANPGITPVVSTTKSEDELFEYVVSNKSLLSGKNVDPRRAREVVANIERLWSKLLKEGGRMYRIDTCHLPSDSGVLVLPDVLLTKYVRFGIECYLNPGLVPDGSGNPIDMGRDATVSDYFFKECGDGEHQPSIHAPARSASGVPPALAGLFSFPAESKQQEDWAALMARSRTEETPRHRTFIALAALAIFALAVTAAVCLCSRKEKQDAPRFSDLDAIINVV